MTGVPLEWYLMLSALMFAIGLVGVSLRRNILVVFMCIELMLSAVNLTFVAFARYRSDPALSMLDMNGHAMALLVMVVAAAQLVVGLAIAVALYRHRRSLNVDEAALMRH